MEKEPTSLSVIKDIVAQGADNPSMMKSNILLDAIYVTSKKVYEEELRRQFDLAQNNYTCERIINEAVKLKLSEKFINELKLDFETVTI